MFQITFVNCSLLLNYFNIKIGYFSAFTILQHFTPSLICDGSFVFCTVHYKKIHVITYSPTLTLVNVFPGTCPKIYLFHSTCQDHLNIGYLAILGTFRDHVCGHSLQLSTSDSGS